MVDRDQIVCICAGMSPNEVLVSNIDQWMLIPNTMVTLDGSECNKIGVGYTAFYTQTVSRMHGAVLLYITILTFVGPPTNSYVGSPTIGMQVHHIAKSASSITNILTLSRYLHACMTFCLSLGQHTS